MYNKKGLLLVVSGPSGVGKGTVCRELIKKNDSIRISVSATTRKPRPGETEGVSYFFRTPEEFEQMIAKGEFLEYMCVFKSNYYGTPRSYVDAQRNAGNDVVLEIDVQGAQCIKEKCPEAVMVFVAPPSMCALKKRLQERGTETPEAMEKRLATARDELAQISKYDYIVVNDKLEDAVAAMESIIAAEKLRTRNNPQLCVELQGGN